MLVGMGPHLRDSATRLRAELQHRLPVYSAETIRHKEAEFIRDKLPRRFPIALAVTLLALCLVVAAARWLWLTR